MEGGSIIEAMNTATLLTVEQFEQLPPEDGVQYELKDGKLVRIGDAKFGLAKFGDERTKFRIERGLIAYILQHPIGEVYSETSFALSPSRVCIPDVSFVPNELALKADPDHIFQGAPDLAVEVVSASESAQELREKSRTTGTPVPRPFGHSIPSCASSRSTTHPAYGNFAEIRSWKPPRFCRASRPE